MRFLVLLIASVVIGVLAGHLFFGLFTQTVPPAVLTSFNKGTAYVAFIGYGVGLGIVIFLWTLLAARLGAGGRPRKRDDAAGATGESRPLT
jgi:hypothetical protein